LNGILSHIGIRCEQDGSGWHGAYRGRGIGAALIGTALAAARSRGLTRVELTVRTDNPRAEALYVKVGFVVEGVRQRHMRVRGVYHDSYLMAVLCPDE
jgi:RimJ/RimL family protein N-acetyltransferase